MSKDMDSLLTLINQTDNVYIHGPGKTDISFSIKGLEGVKCCGKRNIPDGEVFTAPVLNSVNGVIEYNTPTIFDGRTFSNIALTFQNGAIINVSCESGDVSELNKIFDRDDGARFIGEFALGLNPMIKKPAMNILFDEKIAGSIHFTPGAAYENTVADNGNRSNIHWDLVLIQTKKYGGGEIYFDDVLVRKDGLFVLPELQNLNP
jgi:aminopeptidase